MKASLTNVWIPNLNTIIFNESRTVIALYSCQHTAQCSLLISHLGPWLAESFSHCLLIGHTPPTPDLWSPGHPLSSNYHCADCSSGSSHHSALNRNVLTSSHNIACNLLLRYEIFSKRWGVSSGFRLTFQLSVKYLFSIKKLFTTTILIFMMYRNKNTFFTSQPVLLDLLYSRLSSLFFSISFHQESRITKLYNTFTDESVF